MAVEPVQVEVLFSLMRKKYIQVSRLQRDGFLLVRGDPEVWIQSNPGDLLSVRFLEFYKVEKIGDSIGQLSHLTHLFFSHGSFKCLPNSISSLPYLQRLELRGCHNLQELPANLGDLNSLTFLSLDNCHSVKSLPNSISKLSNLTSLHLLFCKSLKELPAISNVVELILSGCHNIQSLPKGLCNLKKLRLHSCTSLTELPTDLNLLQLKIESCCSIQSLPKILTNLQQLHLPLCSIILSLANLIYFRSLWHLTFDNLCSCGAHLKELPPSLWELSELLTLNIKDTTIKWLPWSITKLSKLRLLSLPGHFRLETLPNHLKDSIVISVKGRHIRKTWQQLKTEIQLFSIPIVGLKETHSPSTPGYLQYRAVGEIFIWAFNNMIDIDNLYSLVRILDLDLLNSEFDRSMINFIGKLPELTHLYISNGNIQNLPLPITRLAHFSLFSCDFKSCCDSLGKLSTLQSLTLLDCTNLPAHMDLPVSLTHFALNPCYFDSFQDIYMASMRKLSNLKSLELFGYKSLELPLLDLNLTKLKITHCSIKSLPRCLQHLEIIHSRGVCNEGCGYWDELQVCLSEVVDLETLSVTCYDIKVLPSIARHQTLQELQLKDCFNLRKLPPDLDELVELRTLNVSGTRIKSLPNSITKLKNLQYLILPKYFKLESLPKNFEHKVSVSVDVTDDVYYEHAGYNESCYNSSEDNEITSEVMEGGEEVVLQVSTHDSIIDQASSQSLLKPLQDATQVHEDCSIKSLPRCLQHLEIIHSRELCYERRGFWDELKVCLSEVVDLETLCVTCYNIKCLPSIARHQTLQELQLKDCFNLRKLPSNLNESVKLCTLNVSGTRIQSLPGSITKLQNLRHLTIPKFFTRKCLPKNFEDNVRVFDDDTDYIYYQHAGYYDSNFDSSEDDKITLGCTEGSDEEVSQESTHDSVIKQTSSHSLLKPLPDATQVHEDSPVNGLTDAVDESSFNALCNVPIERKEILSIRNSERNQLVGRMDMEIEQRGAEYDFTNSVQGGCDGPALDIEQNHNPLSDNVKDSKTQKKENLSKRILELRSQKMTLVDAAKKLGVSRSTLKRKLKDYGLTWPSNRKRKQHLDAKSKKQNTKSPCDGKNSSLLNLVGPANLTGHDHGVEHLGGLNQLTLTDEVPSDSMVKIVVQPPMATQCQMDGHPPVKEHSNNAEECRFLCTAQQPNESSSTFVVKATYNEDTVRFEFSVSSSVEQLKEVVGKKLGLEVGKFKIKYLDDDKEWMLMTGVSDMEYALNVSKSSGSSVVRLSVLPSGFEYVGNPRLRSQSTVRSSQQRLATNASASYMDVDEDSFPYYHDLPSKILPYIVGWNDVVGDGHCGFRCVADAYYGDENEWQLVRNHLANEIHRHPDKYAAVYFREREAAIHRIDYYGPRADKSHWMEVNNDLFTIANLYKCAVHFYTLLPNNVLFGCCTVLPWQAPSTVSSPRSELAIALIQRSRHFIRLHLSENYPVPPIAELWKDYRTESVAEWPKLYAARLKHWNSIVD